MVDDIYRYPFHNCLSFTSRWMSMPQRSRWIMAVVQNTAQPHSNGWHEQYRWESNWQQKRPPFHARLPLTGELRLCFLSLLSNLPLSATLTIYPSLCLYLLSYWERNAEAIRRSYHLLFFDLRLFLHLSSTLETPPTILHSNLPQYLPSINPQYWFATTQSLGGEPRPTSGPY